MFLYFGWRRSTVSLDIERIYFVINVQQKINLETDCGEHSNVDLSQIIL
jgi:hypothetical protein